MKKETIELIKKKFEKDMLDINIELRKNKCDINALAKRQRELKDTKKALFGILRQIRKGVK